jgi:hypothetical protein
MEAAADDRRTPQGAFLAKKGNAPETDLRHESVPVKAAASISLAGFLYRQRNVFVFQ